MVAAWPQFQYLSQYATGGGTGRGGYGSSYVIGSPSLSRCGHLNVWGDEWITYDSAWTGAYNVNVQAYWNNVLTWLAGARRLLSAVAVARLWTGPAASFRGSGRRSCDGP